MDNFYLIFFSHSLFYKCPELCWSACLRVFTVDICKQLAMVIVLNFYAMNVIICLQIQCHNFMKWWNVAYSLCNMKQCLRWERRKTVLPENFPHHVIK